MTTPPVFRPARSGARAEPPSRELPQAAGPEPVRKLSPSEVRPEDIHLIEEIDEKGVLPYITPGQVRKPQQRKIDNHVRDTLDRWLAAGEPQEWKESPKGYMTVPPQAAEPVRYMIRSAAEEVGGTRPDGTKCKARLGKYGVPTDKLPPHIMEGLARGEVLISYTVWYDKDNDSDQDVDQPA